MLQVFFLLLASVSMIATESNTPQPPVIVNVYASPTSNASSVALTDATTTQQQTLKSDINVEQYATLKSYLEPVGKALEEVPALWEHIKHECSAYKWHILGGTLALSYLSLCGILIKDNFYMSDANLWSRWKYDQTLTSLCALSPEAIRRDLILSIQQRYLDAQNPTDGIKPLVRFIQAIEQEKKRLTTYCSRALWLKRCKLCTLLPISDNKITVAQDLLNRLNFVNNLFTSWASEHNVGALK